MPCTPPRRLLRWGAAAAAAVSIAAPAAAQPVRPALLVVLVVDQMRADYVETYGDRWSAGLRRIRDDGAWFDRAAYPYRATVTCAGHATIATGAFPARHGMVGNSWWDRSAGAEVTCTTDAAAAPMAYGGQAVERHSPEMLAAPTIADALRAESGRTRVVSLSLKPRSAVTLAGRAGDAVAWFDRGDTWATSTAYADAPVEAVRRFVEANPVEDDFHAVWERARPAEEYLHDDAGPGERPPAGWTDSFPHPLGGPAAGGGPRSGGGARDDGPGSLDPGFYHRWRASPHSDAYLARMALALVEAFALGAGDRTDYLAIGFSALDYVGHRFGPRSHEVQDVLLRLDLTLGKLLDALDARIGRGRYVVALSADHGVSPIPERAAAEGIEAGRTASGELRSDLEALLTERFGEGPHVAAFRNSELYFAPGVYDALRASPDDLAAVRALLKRAPGVWRVYAGDAVRQAAASADPVTRAAALSFFEGRSGDLTLIYKPYWIESGFALSLAASHGSPHRYDTRVPVALYGAGVAPGRPGAPVTPADVAPTLAALAGVELPHADGRVLNEALRRD